MTGARKANPMLTRLVPDGGERRLWRSPEELAGAPEVRRFLDAEFPYLAEAAPIDRRGLLRLMGASLALAGLAGCDGPAPGTVVSRSRGEPGYQPGVPLTFATAIEPGGDALGVLVESQDGRPVKIEGNPLHPASLGATDAFAQAEILTFWDPHRAGGPREQGQRRSWAEFEHALAAERRTLLERGGEGLRLLTGTVASPTLAVQIALLRDAFPAARWHGYQPIHDDNADAGALRAFGRPVDTRYDLTQASVILALDADIFGSGPGHVRYAHDFALARRVEGADRPPVRLYAVESSPGLTGARADHRIVLPPGAIEPFARAVAAALGLGGAGADPGPAAHLPTALAADLRRAGPGALVIAGRQQPAAVHALAHVLNHRLGAVGSTVIHTEPVAALPDGPGPVDQTGSIRALAADMAAGAVSHLLILDGNPAYDAPADLEFARLLDQVPFAVHLGLYRDETSLRCRWHLPLAHALESWGDVRAFDGTITIRQPVTMPLFGGRSEHELLALLVGVPADGHAILRAAWQHRMGGEGPDFEAQWRRALHDGVVEGSALPPLPVTPMPDWDPGPAALPPVGAGELATLFAPDPAMWDGRYANNAWLQELPKPLTKLTWDNAVLIAPATAARLALGTGEVAEVTLAGRAIEGPVFVLPGHAPDTITLPLGYGRRAAGPVGTGVGFDAYRLRRSDRPWLGGGATLRATGRRVDLATTQHHHGMAGRDLVRRATLAAFLADPGFARTAAEEPPSIYPDYAYAGNAWGMTIDQNLCTGCNACVVACQAENNVPVVGKAEVLRGREMHWLRIDRYYAGPTGNPATFFQPMLCQHCEKAPCEPVCPVAATVHSAEGLNDMVYNRCIGTRYCSNNCPYKVRRFNWFDYRTGPAARPAEAYNPDVTVRVRGVMEKCTYCVQRISAARIAAKLENRPIRDGEVVTACQQACPSRAITFGNLNDPDSAVARLKASPRNYAVLGEINTRPRTTYLARIDHPNPDFGTG